MPVLTNRTDSIWSFRQDDLVDAILTTIGTDIKHYTPPGNCQNAKESSEALSGNRM